MPSYPDVANPALLDRLPLDARTVLDVGCATGALGAAYRRFNPQARLLGLEGDAAAAAVAATRLDEVVVGDIEATPMPFEVGAGIDCLVYGDVLEHFVDPWAVLRRQAEALNPDGTILISIPNVEHWSFAARLLDGSWAYQDSGLLDRTHLRWFTLETMRRGLAEIGLVPCDVTPLVYDPEASAAFAAKLAPTLAALGVDATGYAARSAPLQYLWRVRRRPVTQVSVFATMMEHVGGVSHVRVLDPLRAMATDPSVAVQLAGPDALPDLPDDTPRVFVLHRPVLVGEPGLAFVRRMLAKGYLVVTEFDDHPDFFPALQRPDMFTFRGVHAVQTTTRPLADAIRPRNPEVAVFPNAIRQLPEVRNFTDPGRLTLFFGGLNRGADWQPHVPVLNAVAATLGDRLRFRIVHDQALFDLLDTPHKTFFPTTDYATYLDLLGQSEISFMPLLDTGFNRAKSDLKFIEACACRVTALASHVVYQDSVDDGRTGVLFRSPEELRMRLLRLVANPEIAQAVADAGRAYVAQSRMLAYQTAPRIAWYRALWARRAALTAALVARMPELEAASEAVT